MTIRNVIGTTKERAMSKDGHDPECESRRDVVHHDGVAYCASCGGAVRDTRYDSAAMPKRARAFGPYEVQEHFQ